MDCSQTWLNRVNKVKEPTVYLVNELTLDSSRLRDNTRHTVAINTEYTITEPQAIRKRRLVGCLPASQLRP